MPANKTAKITKKPLSPKKVETEEKNEVVLKTLPTRFKISLIVGVIVVVGLLFYFKSLFVAAIVNGTPISRLALINDMDKQVGKRTLEAMITKMLIYQEAKKQNVTVSKKEIDSEVKKIEDSLSKQGQNLGQALSMQGMTKDDLIEQITLQKMIDKMLGKDIKVTDKEINDYIDQNKDTLGENINSKETKQQVAEQLKQKKLSEKVQSWLASLQQKAQISYFINY